MGSIARREPYAGAIALDFLDASRSALLLMEQSRGVIWRNAAAHQLLIKQKPFAVDQDDRLVVDGAEQMSALEAVFTRTGRSAPAVGVVVGRSTATEGAWSLVIWRQELRIPSGTAQAWPVFLAQLRTAVDRQLPEPRVLRETFGLTGKETEIVRALATGLDLEEYATRSKSAIATVRWHLKNALEKTGCRSQRQLLLLLESTHLTLA
ncbi:MAG: LuxR C-terminal-related transcriptional regulator [Hyphomicrobiaceae bacterium]